MCECGSDRVLLVLYTFLQTRAEFDCSLHQLHIHCDVQPWRSAITTGTVRPVRHFPPELTLVCSLRRECRQLWAWHIHCCETGNSVAKIERAGPNKRLP